MSYDEEGEVKAVERMTDAEIMATVMEVRNLQRRLNSHLRNMETWSRKARHAMLDAVEMGIKPRVIIRELGISRARFYMQINKAREEREELS